MVGVLIGFAIIAFVVGIGYLVGRLELLGPNPEAPLSRLAFFVLGPALLFTVLAEADLGHLFSTQLPIAALAAGATFLAYALIARLAWRRPVGDLTIGALGSGYVNANNIGIPVAVYVLGDGAASAPVILLQLVVIAPIALTILDLSTSGRPSLGRILLQPVRNPLIIASVLGLVVAVVGVEVPESVMQPFRLIGAAAVPVILLTFGISLHGRRVLGADSPRGEILLAVILKTVLMPVLAWVVARFLFGLEGAPLFAAVALAALPAAQNVFNYAQRYAIAQPLARDVVLLTTILSLPVMLVVAALLA